MSEANGTPVGNPARRPVIEIRVTIDPGDITELKGPGGEVRFIPFGGTASGPLFSGIVRPGAADVQVVNLSEVRHMCARYILEGTDYSDAPCRIFIDNNGWFTPETPQRPFRTVPRILTDSLSLASYLHQNRFVGEGTPSDSGVIIRIYDTKSI